MWGNDHTEARRHREVLPPKLGIIRPRFERKSRALWMTSDSVDHGSGANPARPSPRRCETNAPRTRETERRNDPNADVTRDVADSFRPSKPANRGHPFTSGSRLFVIHSPLSVLSCPFGAMDLGRPCYPGRRVAARPRRSALGYTVLPLRGVRTTGPAMPQRNGPASSPSMPRRGKTG